MTLHPADVADATDLPERPLPLIREPNKAKRGKKVKQIILETDKTLYFDDVDYLFAITAC